jgi:hypothetical protein
MSLQVQHVYRSKRRAARTLSRGFTLGVALLVAAAQLVAPISALAQDQPAPVPVTLEMAVPEMPPPPPIWQLPEWDVPLPEGAVPEASTVEEVLGDDPQPQDLSSDESWLDEALPDEYPEDMEDQEIPSALEPAQADAATWYVNGSGGSDGNGCNSASAPCRTIQSAIDRARSGDTILVAGNSGGIVYTFAANSSCTDGLGAPVVACVARKRLTIRGGVSASNYGAYNPSRYITIIDGQGRTRGIGVFGFGDKGSAALDIGGFTVRNGYGGGIGKRSGDSSFFGFGGGMIVENSDTVTLRDMIFDGNRAVGGNRSSEYGGAGAGGGLSLNDVSTANLANVRFVNNQALGGSGGARGGYGQGGGLFAFRANINGNTVRFERNIARGGNSGGSGRASNGERGDALGGGMSLSVGTNAQISTLILRNNQAIGGNAATFAGGGFGGGLFGENTNMTVNGADIRNNVAQGGNAENGWLGNGGGVSLLHSSFTLNRGQIIANTAQGGNGRSGEQGGPNGGGLSIGWVSGSQPSRLVMANSIVAANRALTGQGTRFIGGGAGGLWIHGTDALLEHTTVADNRVGSRLLGQGILLLNMGNRGANVTLRNSLITGHSATSGAAVEVFRGNTVTFERGLFYNNAWDTSSGNPAMGSNIGTINGRNTMSEANPLYVSRGSPNYNYHITAGSPARSKATGSQQAVDVDNQPRNDGRPDFGADEYVGPNRPPLAYTKLGFTRTTISLAWQVNPDLAGQVRSYRLTYRYRSQSGTTQTQSVNVGSNTQHTLRNLTPYVVYRLEVQALNANGSVVATGGSTSLMATDRKSFLPAVRR